MKNPTHYMAILSNKIILKQQVCHLYIHIININIFLLANQHICACVSLELHEYVSKQTSKLQLVYINDMLTLNVTPI